MRFIQNAIKIVISNFIRAAFSDDERRSAATNMYLTGRMKTFEIMQLTGHTSEKSFFRYIKVTSEQSAKHIAGDSFFNK